MFKQTYMNPHGFTIKNHWLFPARHLESPNHDDRPLDTAISLLVIHNISLPPRNFDTHDVEQFFLNQLDYTRHPYFASLKDMKVSSHLFIRRSGEVIQFVPFDKRAWHAGASCFDGIPDCNNYSIGIELEGTDDLPFTDVQYEQLIKITQILQHTYPNITKNRMVGHSDIASGRKTDPGPYFDWKRFRDAV